MGTAWDLVDSGVGNYIMANQDTVSTKPAFAIHSYLISISQERTTTNPTSLNYTSPNNSYTLAAIFMLGFNYGTPTVYSGYISRYSPQFALTFLTLNAGIISVGIST
jgi:hypothetical protein